MTLQRYVGGAELREAALHAREVISKIDQPSWEDYDPKA
jgi:hypothetical protein